MIIVVFIMSSFKAYLNNKISSINDTTITNVIYNKTKLFHNTSIKNKS